MIKFTKLKSKNKKGFAMAELLAVCIVVLFIFTILFSNYLPLVAEYENRSVYNNVTAQYAAHHIRKAYAEAMTNIVFEEFVKGSFENGHVVVTETNSEGKIVINDDYSLGIDVSQINDLIQEYAIEEIIITNYKLDTLKEQYPTDGKFYNYIKYLPKYTNYNGDETYRVILKSSEFGYATTGIKYDGESTVVANEPNHPELSDNMIAVRYNEEESSWEVADSDNSSITYNWYDYSENSKMWANSITVKKEELYKYKGNDKLGVNIEMDDVLTMQVWIPRFKYTVWNYNADGLGNNEKKHFSIEIGFEKNTTSSGTITCEPNIQGSKGDGTSETCFSGGTKCTDTRICSGSTYTYTHPAFTFGNNELTGFWVGKFELTGTINQITTKPNLKSLRNQQVGAFDYYLTGLNDNSDNIYGFTSSDDIHMIKNMEWGAVAYLSHSKYGINEKISFNSNNGYLTGCGPQSSGSTSWGSTCNGYDTMLGKSASTTGNIYGVYDMSGGSWEYVMGNMVNSENNNIISGHYETDNSGYNGILYDYDYDYVPDNTLYEGKYQYPNDIPDKYVDKYSYGITFGDKTAIKRAKLGDAIKEMTTSPGTGWYNNSIKMIYVASSEGSTEGNAWIRRGGGIGYGSGSSSYGLFSAESDAGGSRIYYTSRLAIAVIK